LKPQTPAEGIAQTKSSFDDTDFYRVTCGCAGDEHDHTVMVERENHWITVTTYTKQKTKWGASRWKLIWTLLTKGYVEYEACIMMTEQQALNYAETLKGAIKKHAKNIKKPRA
jgi:hypothetical protein